MSSFDERAREWDKNTAHTERSEAIAIQLKEIVPFNKQWKAVEFGAGTGLLSFLLRNEFKEITLLDNSQEMVNVCLEKCQYYKTPHIKPLFLDLEKSAFTGNYNFIYSQMALHHVKEVKSMLEKLSAQINKDGYIAIADLYTEDGSFHGLEVEVHKGFDPNELSDILTNFGFLDVHYTTCYNFTRENGKTYPIFLLIGRKS